MNTSCSSVQTIVLSTRDFLKKKLKDHLVLHPGMEVFCPSTIEQFWQNLNATHCDLLFLDEVICDLNGQGLKKQIDITKITIPIVLISSEHVSRPPFYINQENFIGVLYEEEISLFEIEQFIQKAGSFKCYADLPVKYSSPFEDQITFWNLVTHAVIAWDDKGVIRIFNCAAENLLDLSAAQLYLRDINSDFFARFHPAFRFDASICRAGETDLLYNAPDGNEYTLSFNFSPFPQFPPTYQSAGFMALIRNITWQPYLQNSQNQDQQFRFIENIIETSPNIIFIWDMQKGCVSFINPAVENVLGFLPEEILNKKPEDLVEFFSPDNPEDFFHHFDAIHTLKENEVMESELHLRNKQHQWCWLKSRETVFSRDQDGTPHAIIGTVENITHLKSVHQKLEKRLRWEEFLNEIVWDLYSHDPKTCLPKIHSLLEKVQDFIAVDAILVYEGTGMYLQKTREILSSGEPSPYPELISRENLAIIEDSLLLNRSFFFAPGNNGEPGAVGGISNLFDHKVTAAGIFPISIKKILSGIIVFVPNDSMIRWSNFEISAARALSSILSSVLILQSNSAKPDLSQTLSDRIGEKDTEKIGSLDIKGISSHASRSNRDRNVVSGDAASDNGSPLKTHLAQTARLFSISELATSVAHQISNPLTTIIADSQILMHFLTRDHPGRPSAEAIYQAGWQAQRVIQVLNNISQIRSGQNEFISINETIENALLLTSGYMLDTDMKIIKNFGENLPVIYGNPRELTDVWVNLLLCAHPAAISGQVNQIEISTKEISQEWIEINFNYNGEIFIHEQSETIFESKFPPETSISGHFDGLSICREIIDRHDGKLQVETPDFITIIRVRLSKG